MASEVDAKGRGVRNVAGDPPDRKALILGMSLLREMTDGSILRQGWR